MLASVDEGLDVCIVADRIAVVPPRQHVVLAPRDLAQFIQTLHLAFGKDRADLIAVDVLKTWHQRKRGDTKDANFF